MRLVLTIATMAAIASLTSLTAASATTENTTDEVREEAAKEKEKPRFAIKAKGATLQPGGEATAKISIIPAKGYKWNKDFPAKVTFAATPKLLKLAKTEFKQLKGDFKASDKVASVKIPVTATGAGEETLVGTAKFSVCNDTTCVIEKADVKMKFTIAP